MDIWQIGNEEPFKLTPTVAKRLIEAIVNTEAKVIHMGIDDTCPYIHIGARFQIDPKKKKRFEELLGKPLEEVSPAGGCY